MRVIPNYPHCREWLRTHASEPLMRTPFPSVLATHEQVADLSSNCLTSSSCQRATDGPNLRGCGKTPSFTQRQMVHGVTSNRLETVWIFWYISDSWLR